MTEPESVEVAVPEPVAPVPAKKRGYLVPGVIALVAVSLIAVIIDVTGLEHRNPPTLAGRDVSVFLAQAIQAEHPSGTPPEISCPASEPVKKAVKFTCRWHHDGQVRTIDVTEIDGQGQFTWRLQPAG